MKIVFRISKLGFGGAEQVFLSLAKEFQRMYLAKIIFVVDQRYGENIAAAEGAGFIVFSLEAARTMKSVLPMKEFIDNEKPDVIISAYTDTNAACLLSALIASHKSKVIVSEHASLYEHWRSKSKFKRLLLKFYVSYIYRLADAVVCVSNGLNRQVTSLLNASVPVKTIYNPVRFGATLQIKSARVEDQPLKLIAVGRISEQKDYATLIAAVYEVIQHRKCQLTIVGGMFCQREFDKLTLLIKALGIDQHIIFAGYSDNVAEYYNCADMFVMSSAWEGFGNVIVEAMSFGLPVVSTNCNYGPAEILENGKFGRLVCVGDSLAFANAILNESTSPLVDSAILVQRSLDFSESTIARQYLDFIEEVTGEKV